MFSLEANSFLLSLFFQSGRHFVAQFRTVVRNAMFSGVAVGYGQVFNVQVDLLFGRELTDILYVEESNI